MPVRASAHYGTIPEFLSLAVQACEYPEHSRRQKNPLTPGISASPFCLPTFFFTQPDSGYFPLIGSTVFPLC